MLWLSSSCKLFSGDFSFDRLRRMNIRDGDNVSCPALVFSFRSSNARIMAGRAPNILSGRILLTDFLRLVFFGLLSTLGFKGVVSRAACASKPFIPAVSRRPIFGEVMYFGGAKLDFASFGEIGISMSNNGCDASGSFTAFFFVKDFFRGVDLLDGSRSRMELVVLPDFFLGFRIGRPRRLT